MKKAILILALITTNSFAYYEDPHQEFDMTHNISNNITINFKQAADVTKACNAESLRRGNGGMPYAVDACSFWNDAHTQCTVITELTANFHTIGHEIRHCLQGEFHAGKK